MRATFDSVIDVLVQKIVVRKDNLEKQAKNDVKDAPILFLLGAGCSMQYGLPGYSDLLRLILTQKFHRPVDSGSGLQALQKEIKDPWKVSEEYHRSWLGEFLGGVDGGHCLGYRRLARWLKRGWIDGVINLNFDLLFGQACLAEGLELEPRQHFPAELVGPFLIEPHGGLGDRSAEPRLDLGATELRTFDPKRVLVMSNVVVVGYGGGDDPIVRALNPPARSRKKPASLFFFNLAVPYEPKPLERLLQALARRESQDYASIDPSCNFENLMEALELGLERPRVRVAIAKQHVDSAFESMSGSEAVALTNCRRLADRLRLATSVGEVSPVSIEEHAAELANLALRLAKAAGLRLLPVEKFLIHAVALFHDLGYYWGASHEKYGRYPGWKVHRTHGAMTVRMLQGWWQENRESVNQLIPAAYKLSPRDRNRLSALALWLCWRHNRLVHGTKEWKSSITLRLDGVEIPIRRTVLRILLAAAEQMALEHPFQPSLEPADHDGAAPGAIDDPVLDLFLVRRRGLNLEVGFDQDRVTSNVKADWKQRAVSKFFVARIDSLLTALSECAKAWGGRPVLFRPNIRIKPNWHGPMLDFEGVRACLEEALKERVASVPAKRIDAHAALLDLLAIYCLGDRSETGPEPRVRWESPHVRRAMKRIRTCDPDGSRRSLLQEFFEGKLGGRGTAIDDLFADSFEKRIYPAWRFVGRKWHDGLEATTTALTTLEIGSSRFRSEVIVGLRKLLRDKIEWHLGKAWAHDGCVLCCSRLIIAFSYARLLFTEQELEEFILDFSGTTMLDALAGLLRHFLSLEAASPLWLGGSTQEGKIAVRSGDYLAYVAGAVGFFLAADEKVKVSGGQALDLGRRRQRGGRRSSLQVTVPTKTLGVLLRERWSALLDLTSERMLSADVEDPHSLVLGRVGLVLLSMDYFPPEIARMAKGRQGGIKRIADEMYQAWRRIERRPLSHLSRLYLWPVIQYLDRVRPSDELLRKNVDRYWECIRSPIWVRSGGDAGSWGFNVRTTAVLCSSLNSFWRNVLFFPKNRKRYRAVLLEGSDSASTAKPAHTTRSRAPKGGGSAARR